MHCNQVIYFN